MRRFAAMLMIGWGLSSSALLSSAMAACPAPYTGAQLAGDLGALSTALRDANDTDFETAVTRMDAGLLCADKPFNRAVYASVYRYLGIQQFHKGEDTLARRYFRTALELEPTYEFDVNELDFTDPMREVFASERNAAFANKVGLPNKTFAVAAGSSVLIDGRSTNTPEATTDRPHLVQEIAADQSVVRSFLIDGNNFPAEMLRDIAVVAAAPETKKSKDKKDKAAGKSDDKHATTTLREEDGYSVVQVQRVRPPAKTPLIILGGASVLASGAVYALSFGARAEFDAATTTDELTAARTRTNLLVLASGGVLAAGVGIGYVGVTLDTGPGVFFGARF